MLVLMPSVAMASTLVDKEGVESSPTFLDFALIEGHHLIEYPTKEFLLIPPDILKVKRYGVPVVEGIGYFIGKFDFIGVIG